jgi:hypothetical protein
MENNAKIINSEHLHTHCIHGWESPMYEEINFPQTVT